MSAAYCVLVSFNAIGTDSRAAIVPVFKWENSTV